MKIGRVKNACKHLQEALRNDQTPHSQPLAQVRPRPLRSPKDGEALRTRLQQLGLWRESGHEHFNGCIVVPFYDHPDSPVRDWQHPLLRELGKPRGIQFKPGAAAPGWSGSRPLRADDRRTGAGYALPLASCLRRWM